MFVSLMFICNEIVVYPKLIVYPMSGGGSSGKNYYGFGKGKGRRKGDHIIWEGRLGPDSFSGTSV